MNHKKVISANWHITSKCNYDCKFCFARSIRPEIRDLNRQERILKILAEVGIEKLNIVGGEPQLHPDIMEILRLSSDYGFTTTMQTNGSLLNEKNTAEISKYLDWIGISIDSGSEETEFLLGRGRGRHVETVRRACSYVHANGLKLKINTTVTSKNWDEDMHQIIKELNPDRWKAFIMLMVKGENDSAEYLCPTEEQFRTFSERHSDITLRTGAKPVFEDSDDMYGSYLMISPDGLVQSNMSKMIEYLPIESLYEMYNQKYINVNKYIERGAVYVWKS
jgi:radical S-adenosyl methionine domain-containing protein 2